jgi:hypothetical protein
MASDPVLKRGREKRFELGSDAVRYSGEERIRSGKARPIAGDSIRVSRDRNGVIEVACWRGIKDDEVGIQRSYPKADVLVDSRERHSGHRRVQHLSMPFTARGPTIREACVQSVLQLSRVFITG